MLPIQELPQSQKGDLCIIQLMQELDYPSMTRLDMVKGELVSQIIDMSLLTSIISRDFIELCVIIS